MLDFLDALERLWEAGQPFDATISGIGPDVDAARERADAIGFTAHQVRFTGYADYDTVPDLYRQADVFVSPTYAEGFSNTILEAMASGLAVVSTHSVGVSDCLRDGENGLLVNPGDVPALAKALGADRVELYTGPYGGAHDDPRREALELDRLAKTAEAAAKAGVAVNAGHDLTVANLPALVKRVPNLVEVSIGHGLTADALTHGMSRAVERFMNALQV